MSILQQANWVKGRVEKSTTEVCISTSEGPGTTKKETEKNGTGKPLPDIIQPEPMVAPSMMKKWADEIKLQEGAICKSRRNAGNLASQTLAVEKAAKDIELHLFVAPEPTVTSLPLETEAPHILTNQSALGASISHETILENVRTKFNLNQKQSWAFEIIANNFLDKCVRNIEVQSPFVCL
jgi:hypothetical protein